MTKKEANQQSSNISFKLKLTKKSAWCDIRDKGQGLYSQLSQTNANKMIYGTAGPLSLKLLEDTFGEFFYGKEQTKNIKHVNRKKLSFRSKIFKQTYKWG